MKTGVGLALIAVGAILAFAVTTNTSVFNLHTAGWVLIIIGIIGIAIPRRGYGWVGRRVLTRQTRWRPGTTRRATAPTTSPMRIHQMMTESVITMTSPVGLLRLGSLRGVGVTLHRRPR